MAITDIDPDQYSCGNHGYNSDLYYIEVPDDIGSPPAEKLTAALNVLKNDGFRERVRYAGGCYMNCKVIDIKMALYHYLYTVNNPFVCTIKKKDGVQVGDKHIALVSELGLVFQKFVNGKHTLLIINNSDWQMQFVSINFQHGDKQMLTSNYVVPQDTVIAGFGIVVMDVSKYFE